MSHGQRFFRPDALDGDSFFLSGDEARHATRVLRIREGDRVTLMDGRGSTREFSVICAGREGLEIKAASEAVRAPLPAVRPHLILGAPDMKALEEALLHAVELGMFRMALVQTERSPSPIRAYEARTERFMKIAASAIKQSGNPFLPEISFHRHLSEALGTAPEKGYVLDQKGNPVNAALLLTGEIGLAVGPEGDFTEGEKRMLEEAGYARLSVSSNTLRVETAVLAALSLVTCPGFFSGFEG